MNKPAMVVLHCSATPDFDEHDRRFDKYGLREIDAWHREKGWEGCGYHYVIRRTGSIEKGRPHNKEGAHCLGHNKNSIGICFIGTRILTVNQLMAITVLYDSLRAQESINCDNWFGHSELKTSTDCPNIHMPLLRIMLEVIDFNKNN